ncbi:MAG TPA: Xaa-Pro peptidase family protein [Planctomycetota bacterium]
MLPLAAALLLSLPALQQQPDDGRGQGLFDSAWHAGRRADLMARLEDGVIVLRGAPTQNDYREFRQDNNFWYFTGVTTPDAAIILVPKTGEQHFFAPPANPGLEKWLGDLIDPDEGAALTGIANAHPLADFEKVLAQLAKKHKTVYLQAQPAENWMMSRDNLQGALRTQVSDAFDGRSSREGQFKRQVEEKLGAKTKDITVLLDAMRIVKTPAEAEAMRNACRISGLAHQAVLRTARAGMFEWQLGTRMTGSMLENGAMGPAYMAIVGTGPNANVLHYSANNRKLAADDLVLIDYGAEYNHYVADITRTWPVSGKFSARQREVYQAVYDAQEAAFALCKPGATLADMERAAGAVIRERGFGRMVHGVSHWLGMATHDVGAPFAKFEPGMVFTVEPGVYLPDEGFGVRIEDVVLITEDGYELLSRMIPRSIEDIEALRAEALGSAGR